MPAPKPTRFVRVQVDMVLLLKEETASTPLGASDIARTVIADVQDIARAACANVDRFDDQAPWSVTVGLDRRPVIFALARKREARASMSRVGRRAIGTDNRKRGPRG
jgi:hypothetical protein